MKPIYHFFFAILWFFLSFSAISGDNNEDLIFKGCANQKFPDPTGVFSQNLKTLFTSLVSQSAQRSYAATTAGNDNATAVSGVFQCRGDLQTPQCYDCVSKTPKLVSNLCGGDDNVVVAARVQLAGCYLRYEISGFRQTSGTEMLYRVCGKKQSGDPGFAGKRDTAFGMATNGVKTGVGGGGGVGFYTGQYESVYVLGQCEGSLGNSDCGECVKDGFDKAKSECGDSISAQIYLHKCFVSYSYYSHGVPNISDSPFSGGEKREHTQRTIALIVGGVAVLGFVVVCLLVLKNAMKKKSKYDAY